VFLLNSRHPLLCAIDRRSEGGKPTRTDGRRSFSRSYGANLPSSFSTLSPRLGILCPPTGGGLRYGLEAGGYFRDSPPRPAPPFREGERGGVESRHPPQDRLEVHPSNPPLGGNLRGRLTRRGESWLRKPGVFGGGGSHTSLNYSCRHSQGAGLQGGSHPPLGGRPFRYRPLGDPELRWNGGAPIIYGRTRLGQ